MNQPTLNFPPASRRTDPSTSKAAEQAVTRSGRRQKQAEQVLELVRSAPGFTSAELASISEQLDRSQIARRLPELASENINLIHRGKSRRCTVLGTAGVTWWPGPDPKEADSCDQS